MTPIERVDQRMKGMSWEEAEEAEEADKSKT